MKKLISFSFAKWISIRPTKTIGPALYKSKGGLLGIPAIIIIKFRVPKAQSSERSTVQTDPLTRNKANPLGQQFLANEKTKEQVELHPKRTLHRALKSWQDKERKHCTASLARFAPNVLKVFLPSSKPISYLSPFSYSFFLYLLSLSACPSTSAAPPLPLPQLHSCFFATTSHEGTCHLPYALLWPSPASPLRKGGAILERIHVCTDGVAWEAIFLLSWSILTPATSSVFSRQSVERNIE